MKLPAALFIDADHATGRTYFVNYSDVGADHAGVYVDSYERFDDQWLIARREDRVDWQAANSLYAPSLPELSRTPLSDRPFIEPSNSTETRTR